MGILFRDLKRDFAPRDHLYQLNDTSILLVLQTRTVSVASVMIVEIVAEVRKRLLGEGTPARRITVEALDMQPDGSVKTTKIASIGTAPAPASAAAPGPAKTAPPKPHHVIDDVPLRFAFAPVRDVRNMVVTTYYLRVHGAKAGHGDCIDYDVLHGGENSSQVSALDQQIVNRAERELRRYKGQKIPFLLVWPLHTRTIEDSAQFQRYARVLSRMSDAARDRIAVQVVGIQSDWPISRVQSAIGVVKPFARMVAVRRGRNGVDAGMIASCGAASVSLMLNRVSNDLELEKTLSDFCESAARHGLITVAEQIPTRSIAVMALAAGVNYIHVDYLEDEQLAPLPAAHFDLADLF